MPSHPAAPVAWAGHPPGPVLVTGARGFVGANLCYHLMRRGLPVIGLEGPQGPNWRLPEQPGLRLLSADITDAAQTAALLRAERPVAIVNCAAYGAYAVQDDVARIYAVNQDGLRHLLEGARDLPGLRALIQLGSSSEYGTNCTRPSEDAPLRPDSHYAVSKLAATALCRLYAQSSAVPAFVLRLYSVYGPYEDASRLIPRLLGEVQQGRWPKLASPDLSRDFVFVDDVCRAVEAVLIRAPQLTAGDVFNIGSGTCTRLADLAQTAQDLFAVPSAPSYDLSAARPWDHHRTWVADPAHAAASLAWQPQIPLREGLQRTEHWMRQHPQLMASAQAHSVTVRR